MNILFSGNQLHKTQNQYLLFFKTKAFTKIDIKTRYQKILKHSKLITSKIKNSVPTPPVESLNLLDKDFFVITIEIPTKLRKLSKLNLIG